MTCIIIAMFYVLAGFGFLKTIKRLKNAIRLNKYEKYVVVLFWLVILFALAIEPEGV